MVGLNTQAFECDKKRKYRVFNVEIRFHISDEKYVNAEVRFQAVHNERFELPKALDKSYSSNALHRNMFLVDYYE